MDDLEMLVVDDGSTDGTAAAIQSVADRRVRVITQTNQERSVARNTATAIARGEYVAYLDADDWWAHDKLERQLQLFEANASLGLVYCGLGHVAPDGSQLRRSTGAHTDSEPSGDYIFEKLLFNNINGPATTGVVPLRVAREIGDFRTDVIGAEDWDFALRVARRYQIGFVPDVLAFYRLHGFYMPTKWMRLKEPKNVIEVVSSNIAAAGIDPDSEIARRALANAMWRAALVCSGAGNHPGANELISRAITLVPNPERVGDQTTAQRIGHFANSLYDTLTPIAEAVKYVNLLFDHLSGPAVAIAHERRSALGWTYAVHAFEGIALDRPERVRESFWSALALDPRWLRNLGFVSHGLRSWLPTNTARTS
jgi:hypothetical protein